MILNFHSLRISIIYVSILAFCQVLLNEYDDDDDGCCSLQMDRLKEQQRFTSRLEAAKVSYVYLYYLLNASTSTFLIPVIVIHMQRPYSHLC